ncbi:unnamed protein product [marine sediment metagenome]|uniref:Uncharacterized protein n=1 Tax=marine sediment metagenome TaxID=412755 RepID=X0W844_9ZZZZ
MKKIVTRKGIAVGIILVFIGVFILPSTGENIVITNNTNKDINISKENNPGNPQMFKH